MAVLARMYSRLISCRHQYTAFNVGRNVKCLFQNMILPRSSFSVSRACGNDADCGTPFTQKVLIGKDFAPWLFVGKNRKNINRLELECGREFIVKVNADHILVCGTDAEGVKRSTEKVAREVQRIEMLPKGKVLTDEDAEKHDRICRVIIGRGGKNIKQLTSELGSDIQVETKKPGHILVSGTEAEMVNRAVEKLKLEVQRTKNEIDPPFAEKVLTDEDAEKHSRICRMIIGRGGQKIKQLTSELGSAIQVETNKPGHILVSGTEAEMVNRAVEKFKLEVESSKNEIDLLFAEKVLTDEDAEKHSRICRIIIGRGGKNIKQLTSELGSDIQVETKKPGHILVSGTEAEMVTRAVEKLKLEVQRSKNEIDLPFAEEVLTDEDAEKHSRICRIIIGRGGQNINQLTSELGSAIQVETKKLGHILVSGTEAEMVNKAVEKFKLEVQRAKNEMYLPFAEKVLTDEDAEKHSKICGMIIGRGGQNIKQLKLELGSAIRFDIQKSDHILVSGTEAEMVKRAVEKLKLEVQRSKNAIYQ